MEKQASIVIVENDMNLAAKLSLQLGKLGYRITGIFSRSQDATTLIKEETPDAILLENRLKDELKGMESIIAEKQPPVIYFYKDEAEDSLPKLLSNRIKNNRDILKKEIKDSFKRLKRKSHQKTQKKELSILQDRIFVRNKDSLVKISLADIYYIEADRNYCRVFTGKKQYLLVTTLKEVDEKLPESRFFRIHRSYIVNLSHIDEIGGNNVVISGRTLPLSKNLRTGLFTHLQII